MYSNWIFLFNIFQNVGISYYHSVRVAALCSTGAMLVQCQCNDRAELPNYFSAASIALNFSLHQTKANNSISRMPPALHRSQLTHMPHFSLLNKKVSYWLAIYILCICEIHKLKICNLIPTLSHDC